MEHFHYLAKNWAHKESFTNTKKMEIPQNMEIPQKMVIPQKISELHGTTMMYSIEAFYKAFSLSGKESEVETKFHQYQKDGNTEDMFKYIYNMEEAHKLLNLHITNECKGDLVSIKLREEGNVYFKRKKLKEALEKYNKCILSAPHPKLSCEKIDTNEYTPLALGYGNRSAVLLQLKEYENCICDIERSLNLCNSKITQFKLEERKVNCLVAIERYEEAQEVLTNCKILLNTLKLEEKVKECYKNSLYKFLQQCTQGIKGSTYQNKKLKSRYEEIKNAEASTLIWSDDLIFAYNNPTPPSLDDEHNPTIPAFSRALKLQYSPDQGRYVVATRDIKPGEVIAVETAYASCVGAEESNSAFSFCSFCLARCCAPLPCPECTNALFCNEECRSKGWDKFHMKECPVYSQLQIMDLATNNNSNVVQAYRIIAGQSLDKLRVFVSQFQKDEQRSPLEQILNENQICDSDSYRSVYYLDGNIKTKDIQLLFGFAFKAFVMTQLLIQSNRFFVTNAGDKTVPDEEDIIFIGSLFIRHLLGVDLNSKSIKETHVMIKTNNFVKGAQIVGGGTYIAESLFNHSCIPSAKIFFYGNVGVCRAIRFIPSGSQVYVCYNYVYYCEPDRTIRRKELCDTYSFNCNCEVCVNNYEVSMLDLNHYFKGSTKLRTKARRVSRNDIERTASLKLELDTLLERNNLIFPMFPFPSIDVDNYLDLVLETIEFFDRFVVIPDPMYVNLEMHIDVIFARKSSCYFINQEKINTDKYIKEFNLQNQGINSDN